TTESVEVRPVAETTAPVAEESVAEQRIAEQPVAMEEPASTPTADSMSQTPVSDWASPIEAPSEAPIIAPVEPEAAESRWWMAPETLEETTAPESVLEAAPPTEETTAEPLPLSFAEQEPAEPKAEIAEPEANIPTVVERVPAEAAAAEATVVEIPTAETP